MEYNIKFKASVKNDLKRIDKQKIATIFDAIECKLMNNLEEMPLLKGEFEGLRKFRIGHFRIIYSIVDNDVIVLRIAHRKDVCRKK